MRIGLHCEVTGTVDPFPDSYKVENFKQGRKTPREDVKGVEGKDRMEMGKYPKIEYF